MVGLRVVRSLNGESAWRVGTLMGMSSSKIRRPQQQYFHYWLSYVIAVVIINIIVVLGVIRFAPQLLRSGGARSLQRESGW